MQVRIRLCPPKKRRDRGVASPRGKRRKRARCGAHPSHQEGATLARTLCSMMLKATACRRRQWTNDACRHTGAVAPQQRYLPPIPLHTTNSQLCRPSTSVLPSGSPAPGAAPIGSRPFGCCNNIGTLPARCAVTSRASWARRRAAPGWGGGVQGMSSVRETHDTRTSVGTTAA